jgi:hypothetical protein
VRQHAAQVACIATADVVEPGARRFGAGQVVLAQDAEPAPLGGRVL